MSKYDEKLANHPEMVPVFSGLSNRSQNNLINSVQNVLFNEIENQRKPAKFVAVLVGEMLDVLSYSPLSYVLLHKTELLKNVRSVLVMTV